MSSEGGSHKCLTCFAMVQGNPVRCPYCNAHQDGRRHLTTTNILLLLLAVGLFAFAANLGPLFTKLTEHGSAPRVTTSLVVESGRILVEFHFANDGDRPYTVDRIWVRRSGAAPEDPRLLVDAAVWGQALVVPGHGVLSQQVVIANCPDSVALPVAEVELFDFNGTRSTLLVKTEAAVSCGGVSARP